MTHRSGLAALLVLTLLAGCTGGESETPAPAPAPSYPAPIELDGVFLAHDPAIVKRPDRSYLVAYTGNNIPLKKSKDRITYEEAGAAFPDGAPWTAKYTKGSPALWAPDLTYRDGRYWLYYSASTFGSNTSAIFLATSTTGEPGSWRDHGLVVESQSSDDFNAIDPNLFVDGTGRWWLTFGSFWSGIQQVELDPKTGKRLDTTMRTIAGRGGGAIEAPFLFQHGTHYYLYVAFDKCCEGASSTYRVMVGRSTSPTGPFVDRAGTDMTAGGGTELLSGHGSIHGPGHPAVLADDDGDVLAYHYYADNNAAVLGLNLLGYDAEGWPYVR